MTISEQRKSLLLAVQLAEREDELNDKIGEMMMEVLRLQQEMREAISTRDSIAATRKHLLKGMK